ncbi:ABC transporter substrate-binding protein [Steroidobacter sp.]|uniref:ABC transporter substrate-binding protein n=1 Tax=Steroidobacter sp. TaxID=1978227 RepID=UPI001A3B72B6|nr:ABC transporter substrate-binding protein [Steroidobacter sp.]MBL8271396.1 ABC transporter substrate-binding protein [Steroidobacter sp.]
MRSALHTTLRRVYRGCLLALLPVVALAADPGAIERSKKEDSILIYSNIATYNWGPVLDAFKVRYPWIKVETLDLGPGEAFERYYSESSVKRRTADIIAVAAPDSWMRFMDRGQVEPYVAADSASLPAWSKPAPGVYTISTDPMVVVYNKLLLKEDQRPHSLDKLAALARANPDLYAKKLTTYDATAHPFAYTLHWTYFHKRGPKAWETLRTLGPLTRPEDGGAIMVEKITTGENIGGYFCSGVTFLRRLKEEGREKVIDWSLLEDGTPIMVRGIALTKAAASKSSAQLLLDFVLSRDGQLAVAKGGLTPYRSDVLKSEVPFLTYDSIRESIGEANMIMVGYDRAMLSEQDEFLKQWRAAYGIKAR